MKRRWFFFFFVWCVVVGVDLVSRSIEKNIKLQLHIIETDWTVDGKLDNGRSCLPQAPTKVTCSRYTFTQREADSIRPEALF